MTHQELARPRCGARHEQPERNVAHPVRSPGKKGHGRHLPPQPLVFATSLPNLLVFAEDLQARRDAENRLLIALACHGLSELDEARANLVQLLAFTNCDQHAADLQRELQTHSGTP